MGRYQLYVAVMAISFSLAVIQKASCAGESDANPTTEQYIESKDELEMEHHQCDEYKSKIWNKAFSNPAAMQLMDVVLETAKELGTNDVCSDTIRVLSNFIDVMVTNQNSHYSVGMLVKMLAFIAREADTTSDKFRDTKKVFDRIVKNADIRDYIRNTVSQVVDLLKLPVMRNRLARVFKAFESLYNPSKKPANEQAEDYGTNQHSFQNSYGYHE
uniref:COO2 n=1 Tax=Aphis glycines TaxID=307491 RepID=G9FJC3_APHGL|nr:COO2 [Aphis glycines]